jgi:hypothetical protein
VGAVPHAPPARRGRAQEVSMKWVTRARRNDHELLERELPVYDAL